MTPRAALYQWLKPLVGMALVHSHQDAPAPATPYVVLLIRSMQTSQPLVSRINADGIRANQAVRVVNAELHVFADDAFDRVDAIQMRLHTDAASGSARDLGIGLLGCEPATYAPVLRDSSTWQRRAMLELRVTALSTIAEDIGVIETVHATGTATTTDIDAAVGSGSTTAPQE